MLSKRVNLVALVLLLLLGQANAYAGEKTKGAVMGGPFAVEKVTDVSYDEGPDADKVRHKLDFYYPKGQKDYPVLFFVHGGAWRSGNKDLYKALGSVFAKNGIGVVVINYRLSPKVQHPAHVEDVARAFAWTHKNVGKYGGRADQLFVCGHSAGGHLCALLATDESYLKAHQLSAKNIKGMIPMSGVYEIAPIKLFHAAFGKDESTYKNASPTHHVKGNHPPALIIYADKDYATIDQMSEQFCKKLTGKNCQAATLKVPNRNHISIIVNMMSEAALPFFGASTLGLLGSPAGQRELLAASVLYPGRVTDPTLDPTTQAILQFVARHSGLKLREKEGKKIGD